MGDERVDQAEGLIAWPKTRALILPLWRRILCLVLGSAILYACYVFGLELYDARTIQLFMVAGLGLTGCVGLALIISARDPRRFRRP
ncbi:hypothetical protein MKK75_31625 [Methylobacterium sp. J-030]|uniref:hypothetical protein n=1 Tax=Methylobacterium sp. J-030 TaxID=2836627 RepID=UPI001FB8A4E2|nr:hypothetical protein [Methylobacterium sp. J-030]MCJ2073285.1 hypothetical protein [Methylobacterium sp. J-030]